MLTSPDVKRPNLASHTMLGTVLQRSSAKIERPDFLGAAEQLKKFGKEWGYEDTHLAHRMSWQSMRNELATANGKSLADRKKIIMALMKKLLIPARAFGNIPKDDEQLYQKGIEIVEAAGWYPTDGLAAFLNSSIYNLRPGVPHLNIRISGNNDAHFDETKSGEPPTPQSQRLFGITAAKNADSSDIMTMDGFKQYESEIEKALKSALKSGDRIRDEQ